MLGRAKSCQWQVFVRRRPPKQGELRTDVSKATMFQGDRAAKGFNFASAKPPLRRAESRFAKPRKVPKGFNFVSAKLLFEWAESRFAEPRNSLRGNGFILFACTKRTKSTPEVCEPLDSGDDSNLRSIHDFRRNDRRSSSNRLHRV